MRCPGERIRAEQVLQGFALIGTAAIKVTAIIQQVSERRAEKRTSIRNHPIAQELDLAALRRPPGEDRDLLSRNAERRQILLEQDAKLCRAEMLALQSQIDEGDQRGPLRRNAARRSFHKSREENAALQALVRIGQYDPFIESSAAKICWSERRQC